MNLDVYVISLENRALFALVSITSCPTEFIRESYKMRFLTMLFGVSFFLAGFVTIFFNPILGIVFLIVGFLIAGSKDARKTT